MKKRLISLLLAFSMMLTFLPAGAVSAFAEEEELGTKLQDGQKVTEPGTYYLEGTYRNQITFDVEKNGTVKVNLKGNVIHVADNSKAFLYFKNVENAEIDGTRGTYTGDTFIEFRGKTAKITGGTYTHKRSSVYQSELIAPVYGTTTIDNVTMTSDTYCVRSYKNSHVIIQNSNITGTTDKINVRLIDCYSLELTNNIVKASGSNFTAVHAEKGVVINSGTYTSESGAAVVIGDYGTPATKSIVNGGTFNGWVTNQNKNLIIHGGTFNGMTDSGAFSNSGTVVIDDQNSVPTFQCKTASENGVVENTGTMTINAGTIDASGDPTQTAIYTIKPYGQTPPNLVVNDVTLKNAKYGIRMQRYVRNAIPCATLRNARFENVGCKVYLGEDTKIGVADTYTDEVTIECADPSDGRQLTETTIGTDYQKNLKLKLMGANEDYLVGYKKTEDGKEYRCLSKKVGVTISDPEGEVKAEDQAEFTVTLTHENSTGTGILTFGDKNDEIEYKDENGAYQPMPKDPKDGLEVVLSGDNKNYEFRITPKDAGEQKLTAAVVRDDVELGTAEENFTVAGRVHTAVTIEGLEDAVIKEGKSKDFTVKVDPKDDANLGEAFIDFGNKNSEIEYKDENGEYKLMPEGGLKIGLGDGEVEKEFRITPKETGKQTLTAAVVRDDVKLGTADKDYTVAGRVHTTVAIEGLDDAVIKEGESKDFTVKVTPNDDANLGEAFIDFGNKNGEIEYKDKNGEYKPMPENGLKINLKKGETEHEFRITPKETGKQTLTAAVKKDEKELATDEKDFVVSEMPILTLKDGVITSVTVPGKDGADPEDITEIVKKNANEDGSFHVPEGATVSVAFDKDAFADSGLKFGHWDITGLDDPNAYQDKESFAFEMPAKAVTLKAMTQDASIEDDEPDIVGPIVIGTTVVVGGAVLGYQAYSLGAEFAGKLMALPYFPSNRSALAMMLWEDAGKPMPESELLYPDVGQEERDMDLQHAARWAMENELIPDLNDEGTAPEEMKFYPDNTVSKIDVLKAWQKAQELKQNA